MLFGKFVLLTIQFQMSFGKKILGFFKSSEKYTTQKNGGIVVGVKSLKSCTKNHSITALYSFNHSYRYV